MVEEANEKAAAIESSMARIAEAETRLARLTAGIEVFAAAQDNAIKGHTAKLEQLTTEPRNALHSIDGKLEAAVSECKDSAIGEFAEIRRL